MRDRGGASGPLAPVRQASFFHCACLQSALCCPRSPSRTTRPPLGKRRQRHVFLSCPAKTIVPGALAEHTLSSNALGRSCGEDPCSRTRASFFVQNFQALRPSLRAPLPGLVPIFLSLRAPLVLPWPRAFRGFVHGSRAFWFGPWVLAELPVRLPLQKPCSRAGARTSPARYQGRARRKARIPRGTGTCPTS